MNVRGSSAHGPDDGHPARLRAAGAEQRQRGPGVEQHDRALGQLAGERPVGRRVEVDVGRAARPTPPASSPASSRPSSTFWVSSRRAARSTSASGTLAAADPLDQLRRRSRACRAARRRCRRPAPARPASAVSAATRCMRREERHRPVVGHHRAGEAPLVAQHLGEQPGVGAGRDAVDVGVGVHHRAARRPARRPSRTAAG